MRFLTDYQVAAVENLRNGSILCGGVGTGKSRTSIAYYYEKGVGVNKNLKINHKS